MQFTKTKLVQSCQAIALSVVLFTSPLGFAKLTFNGAEHQTIGDTLFLYDLKGKQHLAADYPLTLKNGLQVSFGQLIGLAGDFFGVPADPISLGVTPHDQDERFVAAYTSLANDPNAVEPAQGILQLFAAEKSLVESGLAEGKSPHDSYAEFDPIETLQFLTIDKTSEDDHDGLYLRLMLKNYDHFVPNSYSAFNAGYRIAFATAKNAGQLNKTNPVNAEAQLKLAYAQLAFASHFLTDSYAAGHMRTPRFELHQQHGIAGDILSTFQHGEDNTLGLAVTNNANGGVWRAYGDAWYFEDVNTTHRINIRNYMQLVAKSLYDVAMGSSPTVDPEHLKMIQVSPTANNHSPMFKVVDGVVQRRLDLSDPYSTDYIADWNQWWTLAALFQNAFSAPAAAKTTVAANVVPAALYQEWKGTKYHHKNDLMPAEIYPGVPTIETLKYFMALGG